MNETFREREEGIIESLMPRIGRTIMKNIAVSVMLLMTNCSEENKNSDIRSENSGELQKYGEEVSMQSPAKNTFRTHGVKFTEYTTASVKTPFQFSVVEKEINAVHGTLGSFVNDISDVRIIRYQQYDLPQNIQSILDGLEGTALHGEQKGIIYIEEHNTPREVLHEVLHLLYQTKSYEETAPQILVEGPVYMYADEKESFKNIPMESAALFKEMEGIFSKSLRLNQGRGFLLKKDVAARLFYEINKIDPTCIKSMASLGIPEILTPETITDFIVRSTEEAKQEVMRKFLESTKIFTGTQKAFYAHPMLEDEKVGVRFATSEKNQNTLQYKVKLETLQKTFQKRVYNTLPEDMVIWEKELKELNLKNICVEATASSPSCFSYSTVSKKFTD